MRAIRLMAGVAAGTIFVALGGPAAAQETLTAELDGQQEIDAATGEPGAGDLEASGSATLSFDAEQGQVCYEVTHDVEPPPFGWHIHVGEAGVNGDIVVNFFTDPQGVVPLEGCADVDSALANEILADPSGFYVNLHNEPFPDGAIRGQLEAPPAEPVAAEPEFTG